MQEGFFFPLAPTAAWQLLFLRKFSSPALFGPSTISRYLWLSVSFLHTDMHSPLDSIPHILGRMHAPVHRRTCFQHKCTHTRSHVPSIPQQTFCCFLCLSLLAVISLYFRTFDVYHTNFETLKFQCNFLRMHTKHCLLRMRTRSDMACRACKTILFSLLSSSRLFFFYTCFHNPRLPCCLVLGHSGNITWRSGTFPQWEHHMAQWTFPNL